MHFEARELTEYGTPIERQDLVVGGVYFQVNYIDDDMQIPCMDTMVFIGTDIVPDHPGFFFQDAQSHSEGMRHDDNANHNLVRIFHCDESSLRGVYDFEHALESLMRCSLRRTKQKRG